MHVTETDVTMKALFCFVLLWTVLHSVKSQGDPLTYVRNLRIENIIIDTDAGSDDGVAIFLAVSKMLWGNGPQIVGITCVGGNAKTKQVAVNVLKTLRVIQFNQIPVYIGPSSAILQDPKSDGYFGKDGFGDVPYVNPPVPEDASQEHAVFALIRLARENPGKLSLVALGPLTNIALAIRLDPNFRKNLRHLIWMGSSFQGLGNVDPGVEFNAKVDPESNYMVFNSEGDPIIVIPWELDQLWAPIDLNWRLQVLGRAGGPIIDFMNLIEKKGLKGKLWSSADTKAMAYVLDPRSATNATKHRVIPLICGSESRGLFLIDYLNRDNKTENAIIVTGLRTQRYKQLLMTYLTRTPLNQDYTPMF